MLQGGGSAPPNSQVKSRKARKPQKSSTVSVSSLVSDEPSHTWTQIYKAARASSRIVLASAVRADHTSTHQLFIVPSTAVMETVNVARRGRKWWPRSAGPARPRHGWHPFTCAHIHTWILPHTTWIYCTIKGELSHCPKKPQCPYVPSNCRKSSTCRSYLVKYLRFRSHRDHLIPE